MFCQRCGKGGLQEDAQFCPKCGAPTSKLTNTSDHPSVVESSNIEENAIWNPSAATN